MVGSGFEELGLLFAVRWQSWEDKAQEEVRREGEYGDGGKLVQQYFVGSTKIIPLCCEMHLGNLGFISKTQLVKSVSKGR